MNKSPYLLVKIVVMLIQLLKTERIKRQRRVKKLKEDIISPVNKIIRTSTVQGMKRE